MRAPCEDALRASRCRSSALLEGPSQPTQMLRLFGPASPARRHRPRTELPAAGDLNRLPIQEKRTNSKRLGYPPEPTLVATGPARVNNERMTVSSFSNSCNLDLFAPEAIGLMESYEQAFQLWLSSRPRRFRSSTIDVYRSMWSAVSTWAIAEGLAAAQLTGSDLARFLDSRGNSSDLSDKYSFRLVILVDRILKASADEHASTAATDFFAQRRSIRYASMAPDPAPIYLSPSEAKRLVLFLSTGRMGTNQLKWQELRNRTSVALQLGAGLTPADVRSLRVDHPIVEGGLRRSVPWKIVVPGNGTSKPREAPLAPWAGQLLSRWLCVRHEQLLPGTALFPSTRSGKPWGKIAQFEASKEVLRQAGVDDTQGGSFRLRHTFALRQLRRRKSAEEVGRWMGLNPSAVADKYLSILTVPADVV